MIKIFNCSISYCNCTINHKFLGLSRESHQIPWRYSRVTSQKYSLVSSDTMKNSLIYRQQPVYFSTRVLYTYFVPESIQLLQYIRDLYVYVSHVDEEDRFLAYENQFSLHCRNARTCMYTLELQKQKDYRSNRSRETSDVECPCGCSFFIRGTLVYCSFKCFASARLLRKNFPCLLLLWSIKKGAEYQCCNYL